jgi:hypothetical protein
LSHRPLTARSFGSTYTPRLGGPIAPQNGPRMEPHGASCDALRADAELAVGPRAVASDAAVCADAAAAAAHRRAANVDPRREVLSTRRAMIAPCDREVVASAANRENNNGGGSNAAVSRSSSISITKGRSSSSNSSSSNSSSVGGSTGSGAYHHYVAPFAPRESDAALKTPRQRRLEMYAEVDQQETARASRVIAGRERRVREVQRQRTRYPGCPALPGSLVESHNVYAARATSVLDTIGGARDAAAGDRAGRLERCGGETMGRADAEAAAVPMPRKRVSAVTARERAKPTIFENMLREPVEDSRAAARRQQIHELGKNGRDFNILTGRLAPTLNFGIAPE